MTTLELIRVLLAIVFLVVAVGLAGIAGAIFHALGDPLRPSLRSLYPPILDEDFRFWCVGVAFALFSLLAHGGAVLWWPS